MGGTEEGLLLFLPYRIGGCGMWQRRRAADPMYRELIIVIN